MNDGLNTLVPVTRVGDQILFLSPGFSRLLESLASPWLGLAFQKQARKGKISLSLFPTIDKH